MLSNELLCLADRAGPSPVPRDLTVALIFTCGTQSGFVQHSIQLRKWPLLHLENQGNFKSVAEEALHI